MTETKAMLTAIPLAAGNDAYVEAMYEAYLTSPESVDRAWREYFVTLGPSAEDVAHGPLIEELARRAKAPRRTTSATAVTLAAAGPAGSPPLGDSTAAKQGAVSRLIQIYANRGHLIADIDPLGLTVRPVPKVLGLDYLGLTEADLDTEFLTGSRNEAIKPRLRLREIIAQLKHIYCGTIGAEFAHVSDETERLWLQDRFQVGRMHQGLAPEARKEILRHLTMAEGLERYLATRYPAQKRFSLEGGDSLIPLLEDLIQAGGSQGVEDIVIGMAHRGRLNVLVNVLGKSPEALFSEFEGKYDLKKLKGSGDDSELSEISKLDGVDQASGALTVVNLKVSGEIAEQSSSPQGAGPGAGAHAAVRIRSTSIPRRSPACRSDSDLGPISSEQLQEGTLLTTGDASEAVITSGYAKTNNLELGDAVTLKDDKFKVVGIVSDPLAGASSDVYVKLDQLQDVADMKDEVNTIYVRATSQEAVATVSTEIKSVDRRERPSRPTRASPTTSAARSSTPTTSSTRWASSSC